jgi:branched-chain amino acid transport system substrate-binding protein
MAPTRQKPRSGTTRPLPGLLALVLVVALAAGGLTACGSADPVLHIGAVFPLRGSQAPLGRDELRGVAAAVQIVNSVHGVDGERVVLDVRDLETPGEAAGVVDALRRDPVIVGAYSSQLSIPVAAATSALNRVYWEAGAVADQLTSAGSPWVFRVGATGSDLGANSIAFAAAEVSPRLGLTDRQTRVSVVWEDDAYGDSVAAGVIKQARADGIAVVSRTTYDAYAPNWPHVLAAVRAAHPDILILASYIPDGVSFRRAMLAAHLEVGALIGSTMSECVPSFGGALGQDAVGIFGSDRPDGSFNPSTLHAAGRSAYDQLVAVLHHAPSEEELSGFTAMWALLHDVLPLAAKLSSAAIAAAARQTNLPLNDLPNGAGLKFATNPSNRGQNLRAAAIIWQWQAADEDVVVWPPDYATGRPDLIPLPVGVATSVPAPARSAAW